MENSTSGPEFKVHLNPAWRDRANTLLHAPVSDDDPSVIEQLWARHLTGNRFEICCVPFFVYDLALGDEVEAIDYVVEQVVKPSGHYTFRVWLGDSSDLNIRDRISTVVPGMGCILEWYSENLLGIDAESESQAQELADFLINEEHAGALAYETGRS